MTEIREAISLWPGTPPGSEDWDQEEQEWKLPPPIDTTMVRNVVYPTITPVLPDNPVAARTGVVICPGGGYFMLATAHEGFDVAHWLADRGVAAFVLKYRVMETPAGDEEMATFLARGVASDRVDTSGPEAFLSEILTRMEAFASIPLADGVAALRLVQTQAHDWGVRADRVGAVGFSAGGRLVLDLALQEDATERPAFVGAIYAPTPERPVPCPPMLHRYSWRPRPTIPCSTVRSGPTPRGGRRVVRSKPICTPKAPTGSGCANRACPPMAGSSNSTAGWLRRASSAHELHHDHRRSRPRCSAPSCWGRNRSGRPLRDRRSHRRPATQRR